MTPSPPKKRRWLIVVVAGAVVAAGLGIAFTGNGLRASNSPARLAAPPNAVTCLGRIQPAPRVIRVAAPSTESNNFPVLSELKVEEGDAVTAGQVLGILDSRSRLEAGCQVALQQVKIAEARQAQVKEGAKTGELKAQQAEIERCEAAAGTAVKEFTRASALFAKGLVSSAALDEARLQQDSTSRLLQAAKEKYSSMAEVREVDLTYASAEVEAARARARQSDADLVQATIRAPSAGTVLRIYARPGEQIGSQGLLDMGDIRQMLVLAEVFETDVARLKVGQKAAVSGGPLPQPIEGALEYVGRVVRRNAVLDTDPAAAADSRVVEVRIRLADPAAAAGFIGAEVQVKISL